MGVAFFWPWDKTRYFFPWQVIPVAPLDLARFLTYRGLLILQAELMWVWLPALILAIFLYCLRPVWK